MPDITIERPGEPELAACLALLPAARGLPAEFLIARIAGDLAGAGALVWRSWSEPNGFPLLVEVAPPMRRRGVGRALVAAAAELARGEMPGLWSAAAVDLNGDQAAFLLASGFEPLRRQRMFQTSPEQMLAAVEPLTALLRSRGHAPEDAHIVRLAEAPLEEIGWMVSEDFGGGPLSALRSLRQRLTDRPLEQEDRSLVLLIDQAPAAVILAHRNGDLGLVDARFVAPVWRRSWPGAVVLEEALRRAKTDGLTRIRFLSDEATDDTMSFARRLAAETLSEQAYFYRATAG